MSTAPSTATDDLDIGPIDTPPGVAACAACRHPSDSHDATSRRFCAATTILGADRRCICRVETLDGAQQAASSHRFGHAANQPRMV